MLQEAADRSVPLLERLFFCGIFSSNLDEYFRVRVASLRALLRLGKGDATKLGIDPNRLLHDIHRIVLDQQERYGPVIGEILDELAVNGITRVDETSVRTEHYDFLRTVFDETIASLIEPLPLEGEDGRPFLPNHQVCLVVELWRVDREARDSWTPAYWLVRVPSSVPRFVSLPSVGDQHDVMFLDDVIRFNLGRLFPDHEVGRSYAVKLTRDADLHVDDDLEVDLVDAIRDSLKNRETGLPSRFLYDMRAPYVLAHRLQRVLSLSEEDMVLGARYHNLNDYMGFPRFERTDLSYPPWQALPHPVLDSADSVLVAMRERDQIIHTPLPVLRPLRALPRRGCRRPRRGGALALRIPGGERLHCP